MSHISVGDSRSVNLSTASHFYKSSDVNDKMSKNHTALKLGSSHLKDKQCSPKSETCTFKSTNHVTFQRAFRVFYSGYAVLDRRYTLPMLPWLVAEIKRHGSQNEEEIYIEVTDQSLKAVSCVTKTPVFEHKLQTISKFAQSSQDATCFTYMTREVASGPCAYHVFQAVDENTVLELFTAMREMSKEMFNQHTQGPLLVRTASGNALDSVINSCQQYEVLYLGRIKVSGKRAPPTFIDDAVEKFRIFNHQNLYKRRRHGSGASVSSLPHTLEILENSMENELQKEVDPSSKEDLSSSSGVSSCESISHRSLDAINQICCDTGHAFHSSQTSLYSSDQAHKFPTHSQSFVSHSQSMDIASASRLLKDAKNTEFKCNLMPPSSLITHTQSLDTPGCADIVRDLRDIDPSVVLRDRVRSCSGDIPRAKQTSLPTIHHKNDTGGLLDGRRPRAYTSPNPAENCQSNRTMLFLIGRMEICLIGTDKKQMLLSKTFNDIAHCSQGVKHLDHFGFICRETTLSGAECYSGYIFRCQTEKVVDEMMQTLKLAFSKAHQNYQKFTDSPSQVSKVFICDSCPMHWFHKLCSEVEGMPTEDAHLMILKRLGTLADSDKEEIIVKFQNTVNSSVQEQNEVLMMLLRECAEQKQISHSHTLNSNNNFRNISSDKDGSKLLALKEKARRSFTSSLESFRKLTSRDDGREGHFSSITRSDNKKFGKEFDARSNREGSCDNRYLGGQTSPITSRPRSSTFSSTREKHLSSRESVQEIPFIKPISNSLKKNENTKTPSPVQVETKGSWRQAIFHRVQTPVRDTKHNGAHVVALNPVCGDETDGLVEANFKRKAVLDYRALWKKAINEQIILIRMEKENKKLQVNQDAICHKRLKLNYEDVTPCIKSAAVEWERLLIESKHGDVVMDMAKLTEMVKTGVPRHKRGEIWQYLAENHQRLWKQSENVLEGISVPYEDLLRQLTSHQHAILIDIGRTFPNHPFYTQALGSGQLSLFNLLKAYSLLDKEVGYCQGLSFVAGILLLHLPEEQAFFMLKYLMFDLGLRRQYKTDMVAFQMQMYQLSRLIHDTHRDLYEHLEKFDIGPTLYAAPWFLTLFASQFSVGFVARLFDLIFLFGMDVVFKVSLIILGKYKDLILSCDGFEPAMNFLKTALPSIDILHMENIFAQVFNLDISRQLHAYEVEYHMLVEEMSYSPSKDSEELENLRSANKYLKAQNMELMEQLQVAYSRIHALEASECSLKNAVSHLEKRVDVLQDERDALVRGLHVQRGRLEVFEKARIEEVSDSELEQHPPPFGVVYTLAGSEKEEDAQLKALIRDFCHLQKGDVKCESETPAEEEISVFEEDS